MFVFATCVGQFTSKWWGLARARTANREKPLTCKLCIFTSSLLTCPASSASILCRVFLKCFRDPIRVPRIREIGSLQVHTGNLIFSFKKKLNSVLFQYMVWYGPTSERAWMQSRKKNWLNYADFTELKKITSRIYSNCTNYSSFLQVLQITLLFVLFH